MHLQLFFFIFCLVPFISSSNETEVDSEKGKTRFIDKVRSIGRRQSFGVRGKLFCGREPLQNVTVKLWDNDLLDPDDLVAEQQTDNDGFFEISGYAISLTNIDPQLRIYHNCGLKKKDECRRKITLTIPSHYINKGEKVHKWFELGSPNMEFVVKNKEEPHCY